jgi:hypothetical protein
VNLSAWLNMAHLGEDQQGCQKPARCWGSSPHRGTLLTSAAVLPAGIYVLLQFENMLDMMKLTSGLTTSGYRRVSSGRIFVSQ